MSAKQIDDVKVVMGKFIRVANQDKKPTANSVYVSIQIEDEDGDNERCILFTEKELDRMKKISLPFAYDDMKAGRLYSVSIYNNSCYLLKAKDDDSLYRLSPKQLKVAEERARKNPEDLTKKSFLTNLTD